jgi:hypothetical protein
LGKFAGIEYIIERNAFLAVDNVVANSLADPVTVFLEFGTLSILHIQLQAETGVKPITYAGSPSSVPPAAFILRPQLCYGYPHRLYPL